MALTELPVRVRFPKGCRVKLSAEGLEWLRRNHGTYNETTRGRVVGYSPRRPDAIGVQLEGRRTRHRYAARFWERTEE